VYRYNRLNVECLDTIRRYSKDIPAFLRSRPRRFVDHCLDRIPPSVSAIDSNAIKDNGNGVFTVISGDSNKHYTVHIGSSSAVEAPSCTCLDWQNFNLPCKHMLAVFAAFPSWGFDALPDYYRLFPHFQLDSSVCPVSADNIEMTKESSKELVDNSDTMSAVDDYVIVDEVGAIDDPCQNVLPDNVLSDAVKTVEPHVDLLKLQSRARQLLEAISSSTYVITDENILLTTIDSLNEIASRLKSVVPRFQKSRLNTRRRFGKFCFYSTCLRRRMSILKAQRMARHRRRQYAGVPELSGHSEGAPDVSEALLEVNDASQADSGSTPATAVPSANLTSPLQVLNLVMWWLIKKIGLPSV